MRGGGGGSPRLTCYRARRQAVPGAAGPAVAVERQAAIAAKVWVASGSGGRSGAAGDVGAVANPKCRLGLVWHLFISAGSTEYVRSGCAAAGTARKGDSLS